MEQNLLEIFVRHVESRDVICDSHQGFTTRKSCLTNFVAFYSGVTEVVGERRTTETICLELCKVFDTVPHHIFVSKLERHESDGWTTRWIRNQLGGPTQRVVVSASVSRWSSVMSGDLRGGCWDHAGTCTVGSRATFSHQSSHAVPDEKFYLLQTFGSKMQCFGRLLPQNTCRE